MSKIRAGLKTRYKFKLVKWEGEEPPHENPKDHPECVEILEWELGQKPEVTFRREKWQAD